MSVSDGPTRFIPILLKTTKTPTNNVNKPWSGSGPTLGDLIFLDIISTSARESTSAHFEQWHGKHFGTPKNTAQNMLHFGTNNIKIIIKIY